MPEKKTIDRACSDKAAGKSASTQAGEFVKQEMHHIRGGKHGARSTKQAIAIGLSEARRAGVKLKAPGNNSSAATRRKAKQDSKPHGKPSARRSRATENALKREAHAAASRSSLSRQARTAAKRRSPASRSASARKAAQTRKSRRA
jgi:hypothetical protein